MNEEDAGNGGSTGGGAGADLGRELFVFGGCHLGAETEIEVGAAGCPHWFWVEVGMLAPGGGCWNC